MELDERFPPVIAANLHTIATFIPYRSPEFKVHSKPGLAHGAMSNRGFHESFAKYELIDGEWRRVYAYMPPDKCKRCGNAYEHRGYTKYHTDPREESIPRWQRTPVCKDCASAIRAEIVQEEADKEYRQNHERYFLNN